MDIMQACNTIRHCNDRFLMRQPPVATEADVAEAVRAVKHYLERARSDGKSVRELEIADDLSCSPDMIRSVMPFVLSAEGLIAYECRRHSAKG